MATQTRCEALRGNVFMLMTAKAPSLVRECERGPRVPNVGLGVLVGALAPLWGVVGLRCVAPQSSCGAWAGIMHPFRQGGIEKSG